MNSLNKEHAPLIDISSDSSAFFAQIVCFPKSYALAVAINEICENTECCDDLYAVLPFNGKIMTHANLPGANAAKIDQYVFSAHIPLSRLSDFIGMTFQE